RWPYPQGRQTGQSAGGTADQIPAGDQPQDRQAAWSGHPADAARTHRRGDRVRIGRRQFVSLLGGAAAGGIASTSPLTASAQQPSMPAIGFLSSGSAEAFAHRVRAFHQGLKETGYIDGENLTTLYRWAEGHNDRLPALAEDLARRQVSAIATFGSIATAAAKKAAPTIPVIFAIDEDPVRLGLVASLSRPGGNLPRAIFFANEGVARRLELRRDLMPAAKRVAVLINPTYPATETTLREVAPAAQAMGLASDVLKASTSGEIDAAFASIARE